MHCPRCGQQQVSDQTKFCSRCGFQLALVGELLANDGTLPQLAELYKKNTGLLTRRNGVIFSMFWTIFFLFIMTPIWGVADVEEMAAICAILGVFGGLMILIGSLVLLRKPTQAPAFMMQGAVHPGQASLHGSHAHQALPPQQTQPAAEYTAPQGAWRTPDTGEFAIPGSVTDPTTKLLKKE
ncbi:MAG: zinc ribbon domain-containing protein [Pyrinomonadaceae bacterium]